MRRWTYNPASFHLSAKSAPLRMRADGSFVNEAHYEAGKAIRELTGDDVEVFMQLGLTLIQSLSPMRLLAPTAPDDAVQAALRRGKIEVDPWVKPSRVEAEAAEALAHLGYDVRHLQTASFRGIGGVQTADFAVHGLGRVDVYQPRSRRLTQIARKIEQKGGQTQAVLVMRDLSMADMHRIVRRVWGKTSGRGRKIQKLLFRSHGQIYRFDRPR